MICNADHVWLLMTYSDLSTLKVRNIVRLTCVRSEIWYSGSETCNESHFDNISTIFMVMATIAS